MSANNCLKAHSVQQKTGHIPAWTIDGHARSSKNVSCGVKRMSSKIDAARGARQHLNAATQAARELLTIPTISYSVLRTMAQKAPHNAIWPVANLPGYHDATKRLSIQRRKGSWRSAGLVAPTLQVGVCSPNVLTIPSLPAPDNTCALMLQQQYGVPGVLFKLRIAEKCRHDLSWLMVSHTASCTNRSRGRRDNL